MLPQETYFTLTGTTDMFWDQPMSMDFINSHCAAKFNGTVPRADWIALQFGGTAGVCAMSVGLLPECWGSE
jgi:hypothetical protein